MAFYDEEIAKAGTPPELREAIENELAAWYDSDMGGLYITSDTLGTAVSAALFIGGRHLGSDLPDVPSDIAGLLNWCINCEKIMSGANKDNKELNTNPTKSPSIAWLPEFTDIVLCLADDLDSSDFSDRDYSYKTYLNETNEPLDESEFYRQSLKKFIGGLDRIYKDTKELSGWIDDSKDRINKLKNTAMFTCIIEVISIIEAVMDELEIGWYQFHEVNLKQEPTCFEYKRELQGVYSFGRVIEKGCYSTKLSELAWKLKAHCKLVSDPEEYKKLEKEIEKQKRIALKKRGGGVLEKQVDALLNRLEWPVDISPSKVKEILDTENCKKYKPTNVRSIRDTQAWEKLQKIKASVEDDD